MKDEEKIYDTILNISIAFNVHPFTVIDQLTDMMSGSYLEKEKFEKIMRQKFYERRTTLPWEIKKP